MPCDIDRIVAVDDRVCAYLAQLLDEVVDERVVVVDEQHPGVMSCRRYRLQRPTFLGWPWLVSILVADGKRETGTRWSVSRKGRSTGRATTRAVHKPQEASARYTPPVPRSHKQSPRWMGPLILRPSCLGALVIILSYVEVLPDHGSGWYLAAGSPRW